MGTSTNAILAYGYDLGGGDGEFNLADDAYELPDWYDPDDDEYEDDLVSQAERQLVRLAGLDPDEHGGEAYDKQRAAITATGVEFDTYCSGEFPEYLLAAKVITAHRGQVRAIAADLAIDDTTRQQWDAQLIDVLAKLGIKPAQEKPDWLLCSYWG